MAEADGEQTRSGRSSAGDVWASSGGDSERNEGNSVGDQRRRGSSKHRATRCNAVRRACTSVTNATASQAHASATESSDDRRAHRERPVQCSGPSLSAPQRRSRLRVSSSASESDDERYGTGRRARARSRPRPRQKNEERDRAPPGRERGHGIAQRRPCDELAHVVHMTHLDLDLDRKTRLATAPV